LDRWGTIYRISWILLLAASLICLVCVFLPKFSRLKDLQGKREQKKEENRLVEQRIRNLQEKQARMSSDPAFVAQVARSEGMVRTNEMVFRLVEGPPPAPVVKNQTKPRAVNKKK